MIKPDQIRIGSARLSSDGGVVDRNEPPTVDGSKTVGGGMLGRRLLEQQSRMPGRNNKNEGKKDKEQKNASRGYTDKREMIVVVNRRSFFSVS